VEGGTVEVRLQGACAGCPMAQITLKDGIERYLKEHIAGLESVEKVD
ncbi:MAG: NifU family protein, partial [Desulfosudaceae bacterium]